MSDNTKHGAPPAAKPQKMVKISVNMELAVDVGENHPSVTEVGKVVDQNYPAARAKLLAEFARLCLGGEASDGTVPVQ